MLLLNHGLVQPFLLVAHARGLVPTALNILANRGSVDLKQEDLDFLLQNNYSEPLKLCGDGSLLRTLQSDTQVMLILRDPDTVPQYVGHLRDLLPRLSPDSLADVARFFDPSHGGINQARAKTPTLGPGDNATDAPSEPEDFAEVFLVSIMLLLSKSPPSAYQLPTLIHAEERISAHVAPAPPRSIKTLTAGFSHCALITDSGALYTWGPNHFGQLGHAPSSLPLPVLSFNSQVDALKGIRTGSVSCGSCHTAALVQNGQASEVFVWGGNRHGQLGLGHDLQVDSD